MKVNITNTIWLMNGQRFEHFGALLDSLKTKKEGNNGTNKDK